MQGQALTSFLQGLSADAVERVEVIPNPSARYEPDGMSGILNIVLKQDRDLGLSGRELPDELDADRALLARIEAVRRAAGERMGLGDVSDSVVPKPVIVSEGDDGDSVTSRYFTPRRCHASTSSTGC